MNGQLIGWWGAYQTLSTGSRTSKESRTAVNFLRDSSLCGRFKACPSCRAVLPAAPSYSMASRSFMLTGDTTIFPVSSCAMCWCDPKQNKQKIVSWRSEYIRNYCSFLYFMWVWNLVFILKAERSCRETIGQVWDLRFSEQWTWRCYSKLWLWAESLRMETVCFSEKFGMCLRVLSAT